ncbi:MAG TPA: hypothetical protein ENN06_05490 [Desulfobacteraceae bacterium]|mgnify:CR=1 FL=1|nr:hypothetical protein [Desulfobacteraceae bacterium]
MRPEVFISFVRHTDRIWFRTVPAILAAVLLAGQAQAGVGTNVYTNSTHGSSVRGVDRSSLDVRFRGTGYLQYSRGNCAHSHEQHASIDGASSGGKPVLVFNDDTGTSSPGALSTAASRTLCSDCHDGDPVSPNVVEQLEKAYAHPTYQEYNNHTMSKLEMRDGGMVFRPEQNGGRRHAECVDCHEPHTLSYWNDVIPNPFPGSSTHTYRPGMIDSRNNNLVSGVLRGTWGVRHTNEPFWGAMNGVTFEPFVEVESRHDAGTGDPVPMREYNICYKCHSYYALNEPDGVLALTGPSGQLITDQAMEFSKNNRSVHPVREGLLYQTASIAKGLAPASSGFGDQCEPPWTNYGEQTMYCSDCHGTDNETTGTGAAKGPHGSTRKFMLKGGRQYWPESSNGLLFSLNDLTGNNQGGDRDFNGPTIANSELFCLNCHGIYKDGSWTHAAHGAHGNKKYRPDNASGPRTTHNLYCVACHSAVPHGVRRSRLIVYRDDPVPYRFEKNFNGTTYNLAALQGFRVQPDRRNYSRFDCWSEVSPCHRHGNSGGYEDK